MRAARRRGVLGVVCCGTGPSPRVRARAPPLQHVAYTRFKADKDILDALVHLREKRERGGAEGSNCRNASLGDAALGYVLR